MEVMWPAPICGEMLIKKFTGHLRSHGGYTRYRRWEIGWTGIGPCAGWCAIFRKCLLTQIRVFGWHGHFIAVLVRFDVVETSFAIKADSTVHINGGFIRLFNAAAGYASCDFGIFVRCYTLVDGQLRRGAFLMAARQLVLRDEVVEQDQSFLGGRMAQLCEHSFICFKLILQR